jgi:S-adenosylmethionine-diacylglycerol 3-amino-3-carboxypropyl transferase
MSDLHAHLSSEQLLYASVWEDEDLLADTLDITPEDDVLSISSAGCNVLALLARGPRSVTAVDLNPLELALLELKLAAIRTLSCEQTAQLVGESESSERSALYERVRPLLSSDAAALWDARQSTIESGIVRAGRLEQYFAAFAKQRLPKVWDESLALALVDCESAPARKALLEARGNLVPLRAAVREHFSAAAMASGRSEAQLAQVGISDVGEENYQRFMRFISERDWQDNHYLERLLTSRLRNPHQGPAYLRPAVFERLRGLVDRVRIVRKEIGRVLDDAEQGTFSKANLSDLFEYLSDDDAQGLFTTLATRLRKGGRFAYWNLLVPRAPRDAEGRLQTLCTGPSARDRVFFYGAFNAHQVRT